MSTPDYAISAGFSYGITSAHNGCLHVEVTVKGKQGHAAMPQTGIDAIEAATHILRAIYGLRAELATRKSKVPGIDTATLNVGLIKGGINTNVVPDLVTFRVDRRMIPEEIGFDAEGEIRAVVEKAASERPGIEVRVERIILAEPLFELPGVEKLIGALKSRAEEVFGVDIPVHGVPSLDAVAVRQLQVGQQHLWRALGQRGARLRQRARGPHLIPRLRQRILQPPRRRRVVLDQKDAGRRRGWFMARIHQGCSGRSVPAAGAILAVSADFATPMFMGEAPAFFPNRA